MNVLSANERAVLLAHLSNEASDDILLDAVQASIDARRRMREDMASVAKTLRVNTAPVVPAAVVNKPITPTEEPAASATEAEKEEPPGEAAARVTQPTKDMILRKLQSGPATAAAINQFINGKSSNTQRVLKRLWVTGVVLYENGHFKQA